MSMSRFRLVKTLYGYLAKTKQFSIWYRTKEPVYSHLPKHKYEWPRTVYRNGKEEIPKDVPKPLGKRVITTTFLDVNSLHDIVTGKSVTRLYYTRSTPPNKLGFKETSHCGDSNIWFRACRCQNSNRTKHGHQKHTKISRCPHHDQGIHVW